MVQLWQLVMAFQKAVRVFPSAERLAELVIRSAAVSGCRPVWAYLPVSTHAQLCAAEFAPRLVRLAIPNLPA